MLDETRIVVEVIHVLPSLIVPTAMGLALLWRTWRLEQYVDGRMEEFKHLLVEKGKLEGMKESIPLAREDRREFIEALKTPTTIEALKVPPAAPKKEGDE